MSRLSLDLVRDSRLKTEFLRDTVIHVSYVSDIRQNIRHRKIEENWQRERELGRGGFGSVWLQRRISPTDEGTLQADLRAVKEIRKPLCNRGDHVVDYTRELEAVAKFSNKKYHHCFVRSTGWYENEESIFICMEYIAKGDLSIYMKRVFPESETREIGSQLVEAIKYLHDNAFAHRDLKPNNIMVVESYPKWWIKLTDFGVSKRIGENVTKNTGWATKAFAAPEVRGFLRNTPLRPLSVDIWAFGEILFQMLTKRPVFDGDSALMDYSQNRIFFPRHEIVSTGASEDCCDLIARSMALIPSKRITAVEISEHIWFRNKNQEHQNEIASNRPDRIALPGSLPNITQEVVSATKEWTTASKLQEQSVISHLRSKGHGRSPDKFNQELNTVLDTARAEMASKIATKHHMALPTVGERTEEPQLHDGVDSLVVDENDHFISPVLPTTRASRPRHAPKPQQNTQFESEQPVEELQRLQLMPRCYPGDEASAIVLAKKLLEAADTLVIEFPGLLPSARPQDGYMVDTETILIKLASEHELDAVTFLWNCSRHGIRGFELDSKEASTLRQSAAELATAAYQGAVYYEMEDDNDGEIHKDLIKAVQWYKRAATLGNTPAMYKVGMILLKGLLGQRKNFRRAAEWLQRAAERADAENPHALHELGLLYGSTQLNDVVPHDEAYAFSLFLQAAELGYKFSQFRVGYAYEQGLMGCHIDPKQSIRWYSRSAAQQEHESELALSGWYLAGSDGVMGQSDKAAYAWAHKAAISGLAKAEFAMGYFTEVGIGVPSNLEVAKRWYRKAATQGFSKAKDRLETLERAGGKGHRAFEGIARENGGWQQESKCVAM